MNNYLEISGALKQYSSFQESILESIVFLNKLLDVELTFSVVLEQNMSVRKDIEKKKCVALRFNTVQVFNMNGSLNVHQILNPEMTNWGLNEISIIRAIDNSHFLKEVTPLNTKLNHVQILWEGGRQIDLVFDTMLIYEEVRANV